MSNLTKSMDDILRSVYDPATGSLKISTSGGGAYPEVATFADLPAAGASLGSTYYVQQSTGIFLINRKPRGLYQSDGANWLDAGDIPSFFSDAATRIYNNTDSTKQIDWDLSGISPSNTRTLTMPDADVQLVSTDVTKEPTGFFEPENVIVTGNGASKTVTLTGTVKAYWRGLLNTTIVSGWTSTAHGTDTSKVYYLYYDGSSVAWYTSPWSFDKMQIALAFYDATLGWVYQRECHGLMQADCHKNDHFNIGAWKKSGGDVTGAILGSTVAADRRPVVSEMVLQDEDLETTQAAITTNSYTTASLTSTGIETFTAAQADIVPLLVANPYYNSFTTPNWGQTLMPANSVMSIWLVSIPMAADTESQKLRFVWGQGQWITQAQNSSAPALTTALNTELLRSFSEMNLGNLSGLTPEFLPVARVVITYTGGDWYVSSVSSLSGSRYQLTQAPSGNFLTSVSVDGVTITGDGTPSNPLVAIGGSAGMATFNATLDFLTGQQMVSVSIADTSMTATKVIQPFYTSKLDEVAVLDMRVTEKSRTVGVGFELTGFTPNRAFGQYNARCIVSGT